MLTGSAGAGALTRGLRHWHAGRRRAGRTASASSARGSHQRLRKEERNEQAFLFGPRGAQ